MEAFLSHIGIYPPDLFAGFGGGLVAALVVAGPRPSVWGIFSSIIVGAFTAAYLGPIIPSWINMKPTTGTSFGVGLGAVPICRGIIIAATKIRFGDKNA